MPLRTLAVPLVVAVAAGPAGAQVIPRAPAGHAVLELRACGTTPLPVEVTASPAGFRVASDTTLRSSATVVVDTGTKLFVGPDVRRISFVPPPAQGVRITFGDGATPAERSHILVGTRIVLQRSRDGDLLPLGGYVPAAVPGRRDPCARTIPITGR